MKSKTLLLVGGLSMRASELLPVTELLEKRGVHCLLTDNLCVGDGLRPNDDETLTIALQAGHQWELVEKSQRVATPINIFGMSMGGMIAATMTMQKPDRVEKLIVAVTTLNSSRSPTISRTTYEEWIAARTEEQLTASVINLFGRTTLETKPHLRDQYTQYRLAGKNGQRKKDFIRQLDSAMCFRGEEIYRALRPIASRITVLSGKEDTLFPESHADEIAKLLMGAQRVVLPAAGHMIHLENPEGLVEAISQILGT